MGYSENTNYINCGDTQRVANQLTKLLQNEGMRLIPRPRQRERLWYEPMQYNSAFENNIWGLAVFPGDADWTVIKTAPLELLGERASGKKMMRLVELCSTLQSPGFQINLYDSCQMILVETNGLGEYRLSGFGRGDTHNPDPLQFYGECLAEDRIEVRFELLPLQKYIEDSRHAKLPHGISLDGESLIHNFSHHFGGANKDFCNNSTSIDTLISCKPFAAKSGIQLYFIWPPNDRPEPPRRTLQEHYELLLQHGKVD
jgi:hypothetical protein